MSKIFLPDFVAFPVCYEHIRVKAQEEGGVIVDYHDYWPYSSVEELSRLILADIDKIKFRTIVGYSFGAHVAARLCAILASEGHFLDLVLIDPPRLEDLSVQSLHAIESDLRSDPNYNYIFELVSVGLSNLQCMLANIHMLAFEKGELPKSKRCIVFLARDSSFRETILRSSERDVVEDIYLHDADHRSIIQHHMVVDCLLRAPLDAE